MSHTAHTPVAHGAPDLSLGHAAHGVPPGHDEAVQHHALPGWLLFGNWVILMSLTGLTVFSAQYHLGAFDIPIAMTIATIKAFLVMLIFMHLLWDKGFHSVLIFGSLLFVWLFIGFAMIDRGQYQPSKDQFDRDVIQSQP
jgi:cytochrome c oxidase subunit 4